MKKIEEIEEKIKEERLLEATKKGFYGQNGKIIFILKMLGEPIISQNQGGIYSDFTYLPDPYEEESNLNDVTSENEFLQEIPVMNLEGIERPNSSEWSDLNDGEYTSIVKIGHHFCGLNRGMHMEIKYDDSTTELYLTYKGYLVYKEIKGELLCYVPIQEWEDNVEKLYKISKEKLRQYKEKEFEQSIKEVEKNKQSWFNSMKKKWGFSV
jgi:hypothetical protein